MSKIKDFLKSPLGTALCAAAACLLAVVLVLIFLLIPSAFQRKVQRQQRNLKHCQARWLQQCRKCLVHNLIKMCKCTGKWRVI